MALQHRLHRHKATAGHRNRQQQHQAETTEEFFPDSKIGEQAGSRRHDNDSVFIIGRPDSGGSL
jgi:hypothetical protein